MMPANRTHHTHHHHHHHHHHHYGSTPDQCDPFNVVPMSRKTDVSTWARNPLGMKPLGHDLRLSDGHRRALAEIRAKDWSSYHFDKQSGWVDPVYVQDKGYSYKGQVKDGVPHGIGIMVKDNGKRYEGMFENGEFTDNNGRWMSKNGHYYVGGFKNFKFNGTGTYTWSNGDTYTGEWSDHKRHGTGSTHLTNRSSHIC